MSGKRDRDLLPKGHTVTPEIATSLAILGVAILLFVTDRVPMDVVAMAVLVVLAIFQLVTPAEALSGFSSPAVVTVWAVLVLSAGLTRTGLAGLVGRHVQRLAGDSEQRLVLVIMLVSAALSGFMNSVGVAALMLPVVVDIARRTGRPPSRLLMPLASATLLGGMLTLLGTPVNILISEVLREKGLRPFGLFDFAPTGLAVTLVGIAFMVWVGRHLLPLREAKRLPRGEISDPAEFFGLHERLYVLRVPQGSSLAGKTLAQSRLGAVLGLNVVHIQRAGAILLAPAPETVLQMGDRLLAEGRIDRLKELQAGPPIAVDEGPLDMASLLPAELGLAEIRLGPACALPGKTLEQAGFRRRFGVVVLAIQRGQNTLRAQLEQRVLEREDVLLVQGPQAKLEALQAESNLVVHRIETAAVYRLEERLMSARVPSGSPLAGKMLSESRLGDAYGLWVMGIERDGTMRLPPDGDERLEAGDVLLLKGKREDVQMLEGLRGLEVEEQALSASVALESEQVGLLEVVLSPRADLAGRTLRQLRFREKYGLSVLAIWRAGRTYRSGLRDMVLQSGDALLLYGPRERAKMLAGEPAFLILTAGAQEMPRREKAPLALLIMAGVLVSVIAGWSPIAIAAVMGMMLMVVSGCLTMEEAYRAIEWKAVFLIAGMLPLGIALERSGAAQWVAGRLIAVAGDWGALAVMAGLGLITVLASQAMPNPAVALLLAPIAISAATDMGVSPYPLCMMVAVAASAAFLSPVGHSSNLLIMAPGGYRFTDYVRVGLPLSIIVLASAVLTIPLVWPF
jgi:di/tricarboxylate transporter